MSDAKSYGPFEVSFTFTKELLDDFEAMYLYKKEIPAWMRLAMGIIGGAGAIWAGYSLYRDSSQLMYVLYLLIASFMLLLAFTRRNKKEDPSIAKYRKYYTGHRANYRINENGVEMQLEGQKIHAKSKFKEIYGLFDTDRCLYFLIKGRAYYIIPRDSVTGGSDDDLMAYMQKKCAKRFLHYDLNQK